MYYTLNLDVLDEMMQALEASRSHGRGCGSCRRAANSPFFAETINGS